MLGLVEFIWKEQRETGDPVGSDVLARFFNCSPLAVRGRMRPHVKHPIYEVYPCEFKGDAYVIDLENMQTYYSIRSNDADHHG